MLLTELQKQFQKSITKITKDMHFMIRTYMNAGNDETRQKIIDGIEDGTLKTQSDIETLLNLNKSNNE